MNRYDNQRGQTMVLSLLFMVALMAVATGVLDVGSWYRTHRHTQATADAAALAAAQELPEETATATSMAVDYGDRNDGGVAAQDVVLTSAVMTNDTVKVTARKNAPVFLSRLFGFKNLTARASATARVGVLGSARYAAPIGVDLLHPMLQCEPLPCFNQTTQLDLEKTGPGAFRLINIDGSKGGTSPQILGDWLRNGYDGYMPINWYFSDPGAKFDSNHIQGALDDRIGSDLLFPVYSDIRGGGTNFQYEVIGWVGFHLTGYDARGNGGKLVGWFTHIVWEGIYSEHATGDDFGARSVSLVE
jgi:Flp pilus assembly protein TadG